MPTEFELLKQELEIERKRNLDQDSSYQAKLGQYKYFLKIQEDKVKNERKERELLLEDFKEMGLLMEDDLKGKGGRPSKRVKLMEDSRKELQEVQKEAEEQRKLTEYSKKQTQKLRGKMAKERQT